MFALLALTRLCRRGLARPRHAAGLYAGIHTMPCALLVPVPTCSACNAPYAGKVGDRPLAATLKPYVASLALIGTPCSCMTLCLSSPRPLPLLLLMTLTLLWLLRPPSLMPQLPLRLRPRIWLSPRLSQWWVLTPGQPRPPSQRARCLRSTVGFSCRSFLLAEAFRSEMQSANVGLAVGLSVPVCP